MKFTDLSTEQQAHIRDKIIEEVIPYIYANPESINGEYSDEEVFALCLQEVDRIIADLG